MCWYKLPIAQKQSASPKIGTRERVLLQPELVSFHRRKHLILLDGLRNLNNDHKRHLLDIWLLLWIHKPEHDLQDLARFSEVDRLTRADRKLGTWEGARVRLEVPAMEVEGYAIAGSECDIRAVRRLD